MRLFYIVSPEMTQHIGTGWHSVDLGNGKLLVCVDWKNGAKELAWSEQPGVISLPHPIFESTVPLTDEHLSHLNKYFQLENGDTVHRLIKQASRHDPWMRVHVL